MTLNGLKKPLNSMKISQEAIMIKVMKDIFLNLIFNTWKIYTSFTMIHPFCVKECWKS